MAPRRANRDQGFALVAVVWVVALLCIMALDVLAAAQRESRTSGSLRERAQLVAAADAGISLGILALLGGSTSGQVAAFDGVRLDIGIEDEGGKIDLNAAPPRLLRGLFEALDIPSPQAEALSLAIQDWRDTDEVTRPGGGAEAREYRLARSPIPPRDGAFQSVDELIHVRGMSPELVARAAPALTVHARQGAFDRRTAPPLVQAAAGDGGRPASPAAQTALSIEPEAAVRVYTVRVVASTAEGRFERSAVVRLTGNPRDPYWIQQYR